MSDRVRHVFWLRLHRDLLGNMATVKQHSPGTLRIFKANFRVQSWGYTLAIQHSYGKSCLISKTCIYIYIIISNYKSLTLNSIWMFLESSGSDSLAWTFSACRMGVQSCFGHKLKLWCDRLKPFKLNKNRWELSGWIHIFVVQIWDYRW